MPVTRQTEDGSFELVYETVDVDDEESEVAPAATVPLWRRKPVLWAGFGVLALLLLVGGIATVTAVFGPSEPKARKVATAKKSANNGPNEAYEYVPPAENDGRIDLANDGDDDDSPPPRGEAVLHPGAPTGEDQDDDLPSDGAAVVPPPSVGAAGGSGAPFDSPGIGDSHKSPGLQLRPSLPDIAPRLGDPLKVQQDVLRDRLGGTGLTGSPTGAGGDDSHDDSVAAGTGDDEESGPGDDGEEEEPVEGADAEDGALEENLEEDAEREDDEVEREDDEQPE